MYANTKFLRPLVLIALLAVSCKEAPKKIATKQIAFKKEGEVQLFKAASDSPMATLDIEIAETEYETQTGLMYREHMEDSQGMLFIFPDEAVHAFYMKNTLIPLDIIYLKANGKVASIRKNAQPMDETSLSSDIPIQYVLEVNAGLADRWGLAIGDSLAYSRH